MQIKYEYMNGKQVACDSKGTPLKSLFDNGLCLVCENEIDMLTADENEKYCLKHQNGKNA